MINTFFHASIERAYAAAVANDPGLSRPRHPAPVPLDLSAGDVAELRARVDELPGAWCVQRHVDCDGAHSAMLMPEGADEAAPTFVVYREAERVCLDVCRDDSYVRLGSYGTLAQATQGAVKVLTRTWPGH